LNIFRYLSIKNNLFKNYNKVKVIFLSIKYGIKIPNIFIKKYNFKEVKWVPKSGRANLGFFND